MIRLGLVGMLLVSLHASALAVKAELIDTRYQSGTGISRLYLTFDRPAELRQERFEEDRVRLSFVNTSTTLHRQRPPQVFKSGHVRSISFDPMNSSVLNIIAALRPHVLYEVRTEGHAVVVEFFDADTTALSGMPVDVRRLVLRQMERAEAASSAAAAPATRSGIRVVPLVISLVFSLIGAIGFVKVMEIIRRQKKNSGSKKSSVVSQPVSRVDALLEQAQLVIEEKMRAARPTFAVTGSVVDREDAEAAYVKKFQRGRGEYQLAKRFEAKGRDTRLRETTAKVSAKTKSTSSSAKKLGLAKGELDLALALKKLRDNQQQKESKP